uniref:KH domain-containing protein n=1 Tax=Elaeophora elaphi TaxID=1147741 RepID=A0A0R3RUI0_9BILA
MSDSGKSSVAGDIANLNFTESEDLDSGKANESVPSIDSPTSESVNSNDLETMNSVTDDDDDSKKKTEKKSTISSDNSESSDSEEQHSNEYSQKTSAEYLARLIQEKESLKAIPRIFKFKHAIRLIDAEIAKIRESIGELAGVNEERAGQPILTIEGQEVTNDKSSPAGKKVLLQEKIFIPVNEHPSYNFVGRILGPRGMTARQLEEEYGCRIMIRGRGSTREGNAYHRNMSRDDMKEALHVVVQCEDVEEIAKEKLKRAIECIQKMLVPPQNGEDELKRKQLMELSIINGTYRPTNASRTALRNRPPLPSFNADQITAGNTVHGANIPPLFPNGRARDDGRAISHNSRTGVNTSYNFTQQHSYNAHTANTRQALASLGFDMDAFEVVDCYGKRMGRARAGQAAAAATATAAAPMAQYPLSYGFRPSIVDPFAMQYVWTPTINPSMLGVYDNSYNALATEYYNQVVTRDTSATRGHRARIGDRMAQPSNVQPVNLQQCITAAAMLSGTSSFRTDASGDGPNGHQ